MSKGDQERIKHRGMRETKTLPYHGSQQKKTEKSYKVRLEKGQWTFSNRKISLAGVVLSGFWVPDWCGLRGKP